MGQDVWFIMAGHVCSSSYKDSAVKSADEGSAEQRGTTATVTSESLPVAELIDYEESIGHHAPAAAVAHSSMSEKVTSPKFPLYDVYKSTFAPPGHEEKCLFERRESTPVPNIVVEHAPPREAHEHRLMPTSSAWALSSPSISTRQIRALSDSSVNELPSSFYIPSPETEFHYHRHPLAWKSLSDVGRRDQMRNIYLENCLLLEGVHPPTLSESHTGVKNSSASRLSAVIEPEQGDTEFSKQSDFTVVPFHWRLHSDKVSYSEGRSPKTYWMRRHSDSNLATRLGPGLRAEPYSLRSRSTGDSTPSNTVLPESSTSVSMDESSLGSKDVVKEVVSFTEMQLSAEKSPGLYEKRLKLKKYLQTRYQTSLQEMKQSVDVDDVFTDRVLDLSSPSFFKSKGTTPTPVSTVTPHPLPSVKHPERYTVVCEESECKSPTASFHSEKQKGMAIERREGMYSLSTKTSRSEGFSRKAMEGLPAAVSRVTESPIFVFPTVSHEAGSEQTIRSSYMGQHGAQSQISSRSLVSHFDLTEPVMSGVESHVPEKVSTMEEFPLPQSHKDQLYYQKRASEELETQSPVFVGLSVENKSKREHPSSWQWEKPQQRSHMSVLTRPQSYSSLVTYPPISEQPNFPLPRFPSTPVLSDLQQASSRAYGRQNDPGDTSYLRVSSPPPMLMSSEQSLAARRLEKTGSSQDDTATARPHFNCPMCSQDFFSYGLLASHMSCHLPVDDVSKENTTESLKIHLCRICNRAFSRSDMLTRHTRLHTGLRPYECRLCGQVFSRSDHLHTHLRTHTGEKPYKCANCPYAAPRRDMVTRHMRIHTRDVSHRGQRSSSVSSDVPTSPSFTEFSGLSAEEVYHRIQSLSTCEPRRSGRTLSSSGHDSSTSTSVDATDTDVGLIHQVLSCRTCSLTSNESFEGADQSHVFPTCSTWSNTSVESLESFSSPLTRERLSWSSSTDSPDVFCRTSQNFFWSVQGHRTERSCPPLPPPPPPPPLLYVDTLSIEMQSSFERCTVTTPKESTQATASQREELEPIEDVQIKKESTQRFDADRCL